MTREEAIKRLNIHKSTSVFVDSIAEAIDMAIEALSEVRCNDCKWNDDVVEVVRCKDCKYFDYSGSCDINTGYCNEHGIDFKSEDFCSYGEREDKWE